MEGNCILLTLVYFVYSLSISEAKEAPFIHKCKAEDSPCIISSAQVAVPILTAGIPSLSVDPLDPLVIDKIDASLPNLKLILTDVTTTGMKNCVITKAGRDLVKSTIFMETFCSLALNGYYDISGQLLTTPIEGHGKIKIDLKNSSFSADVNIDNVQKEDGKNHWHVRDWSNAFVLNDKASIALDNLYNGNEALARAAEEVLANNLKEVVMQIGKPIIDSLLDKIMMSINQFYDAVESENLALD